MPRDDIAMPGFFIEFKHSLKRAWEDHEDKKRVSRTTDPHDILRKSF